ncbi:hypothetical protein M9458_026557, partial [Cirrhinus mrigala]
MSHSVLFSFRLVPESPPNTAVSSWLLWGALFLLKTQSHLESKELGLSNSNIDYIQTDATID